MKTVRHTLRMQQPLHVETEGCIINVFLVANSAGQPVTVVQVNANDYPVDRWAIEHCASGEQWASIRVVKQKEG